MSGTPERETSFDYVRRTYGVPAKRGLRVTVDGKPGVITRGRGGYIMVRFDGWKHARPCHPTWRVDYAPSVTALTIGQYATCDPAVHPELVG